MPATPLADEALADVLLGMARSRWSGVARLSDERGVAGSMIWLDGRLAWATARDHLDDLGAALLREELVDEAGAAEVRRRFLVAGRLGQLALWLEVGGGVSTQGLRSSLKRYLRGVLTTLLSRSGLSLSRSAERLALDDQLMLGWDELFVDDGAGGLSVRPSRPASRGLRLTTEGLEASTDVALVDERLPATGLELLEGASWALVISEGGGILAMRGLPSSDEAQQVAQSAAALLAAQRLEGNALGLGSTYRTVLHGEEGVVAFRRIQSGERGYAIVAKFEGLAALDPGEMLELVVDHVRALLAP